MCKSHSLLIFAIDNHTCLPHAAGRQQACVAQWLNVSVFWVQYVFMDGETYEEQRVQKDDAWAKYLREGQDVQLVLWKGMVISVDLPKVLEIEVVRTDPNIKGNTAAGGSKPATLETGAVIQVWLLLLL